MPSFNNTPTDQTPWQIFTHDASNDAASRKGQTFWGLKIGVFAAVFCFENSVLQFSAMRLYICQFLLFV